MTVHIHTYGCMGKLPNGRVDFACGNPVGPEAVALIQAFNADDPADFRRLAEGASPAASAAASEKKAE